MQFQHLILGPLGLATLMIVAGVSLDFARQWWRTHAAARETNPTRKGDDLGHRDARPGDDHFRPLLRAGHRL